MSLFKMGMYVTIAYCVFVDGSGKLHSKLMCHDRGYQEGFLDEGTFSNDQYKAMIIGYDYSPAIHDYEVFVRSKNIDLSSSRFYVHDIKI